MKQSCASCKHALFKGRDHYGQCTIHWCLNGSAHPMISKDWTCGSDCKDYYCYEKLAEIIDDHAAEVERLTAERDALEAQKATHYYRANVAAKERDAAVARSERMLSAVCAWQIQFGTIAFHRLRPSPWELAAKRCWAKNLDLFDENARLRAILAGHSPATPQPTEKQKLAMHYGSIGAISLEDAPATKGGDDE